MGIIRIMLAIAVLNSHFPICEFPMVDGHEAVLTFFVLSGFYMGLVLDTSYISAKHFYQSRFLALYPMYVFALAFSLALISSLDIHPMTSSAELAMLLSDPIAFATMLWTSIGLVGQELLFCLSPVSGGGFTIVTHSRDAMWHYAPLIQAWSLSLEIIFYTLAPMLVVLRNRTLLYFIMGSLILKLAIVSTGGNDIVFFKRFFLAEFWLFGAGIMSYRVYRILPRTPQRYDIILFILFITAILHADLVPEYIEAFFLPGIALMVIPFVFRRFKNYKTDKLIGKISYPFYLLHFSIIAIFETYSEEPQGWSILIATLVSSTVLHYIFAPGTEFLKDKISKRHKSIRIPVKI